MDTGTIYRMLFVPYCLSITLVSKNYKRGGRGGRFENLKIKIFLLRGGEGV